MNDCVFYGMISFVVYLKVEKWILWWFMIVTAIKLIIKMSVAEFLGETCTMIPGIRWQTWQKGPNQWELKMKETPTLQNVTKLKCHVYNKCPRHLCHKLWRQNSNKKQIE